MRRLLPSQRNQFSLKNGGILRAEVGEVIHTLSYSRCTHGQRKQSRKTTSSATEGHADDKIPRPAPTWTFSIHGPHEVKTRTRARYASLLVDISMLRSGVKSLVGRGASVEFRAPCDRVCTAGERLRRKGAETVVGQGRRGMMAGPKAKPGKIKKGRSGKALDRKTVTLLKLLDARPEPM